MASEEPLECSSEGSLKEWTLDNGCKRLVEDLALYLLTTSRDRPSVIPGEWTLADDPPKGSLKGSFQDHRSFILVNTCHLIDKAKDLDFVQSIDRIIPKITPWSGDTVLQGDIEIVLKVLGEMFPPIRCRDVEDIYDIAEKYIPWLCRIFALAGE